MKVNKPKSTFAGGVDGPDKKEIAKALKGERFADALRHLKIQRQPTLRRV